MIYMFVLNAIILWNGLLEKCVCISLW